MTLWDYKNHDGDNLIRLWARKERLTPRERGQLNQKLDTLVRIGFDLAHGTFLRGPIEDHTYKLVVHSTRMLRPMLCRGPLDNHAEATLLCGAIERDWKLDPPDALARAAKHREHIRSSKGSARVGHERF